MSECRHIIRHPQTSEERKEVVARLQYCREVGDTLGIMMCMAQLSGCPKKEEAA
jgi:hypothetical protein